jgi:hypothetical protein
VERFSTSTAFSFDSPHEKAWRASLREPMESDWQDIRDQTTWSPDAFAPRVYEQYVSRKPRMRGTRAGRWPSVWWVMASWC